MLRRHAVNTEVDIRTLVVLEPQDGDSHFISGQSFGLGMTRATSIQPM